MNSRYLSPFPYLLEMVGTNLVKISFNNVYSHDALSYSCAN
jgi:hypothetical protein